MISVSVRVSLNYGEERIFDDFRLTLESGKLICLLGKSGSGKSTLLRFIAGLMSPDIATGSVVASDDSPLNGRIAWMAQQDLLLPWLKVIDNVMIGSFLRGENGNRRVELARQLLEKVELSGVDERYPHELSGGMRQRVALARTLIEDRAVNLLDEPFSGLDATTRYQLQDLACTMLTKTTTLLVTHDPLEAVRMADFIYVLSGRPATVAHRIEPPGSPPRQLSDVNVSNAYADLMHQLVHPESSTNVV
ncbi:MAG: ABC transporter ATP-binding protein [Acidiferrobacterales bacterium]|nr:ABC transporter ATP-binding protein [Acidiferrobacterales bacterium]